MHRQRSTLLRLLLGALAAATLPTQAHAQRAVIVVRHASGPHEIDSTKLDGTPRPSSARSTAAAVPVSSADT